jgi:hypothetical protein
MRVTAASVTATRLRFCTRPLDVERSVTSKLVRAEKPDDNEEDDEDDDEDEDDTDATDGTDDEEGADVSARFVLADGVMRTGVPYTMSSPTSASNTGIGMGGPSTTFETTAVTRSEDASVAVGRTARGRTA